MGKIITRLTKMLFAEVAEDDVMIVQDVSVPKTKAISVSELRKLIVNAASIVTDRIANGAITTPKFKPTVINPIFTLTGARYNLTTASTWSAVTNCSFSYTAGAVDEKLVVRLSIMANKGTSGNGEVDLYKNGVALGRRMYIDSGSPWVRCGQDYVIDVPANTTVTIALYAWAANTSGFEITTENANWRPTIVGMAVAA